MLELEKSFPLLSRGGDSSTPRQRYQIVEGPVGNTCFYTYGFDGKRLVLVLNQEHPFYRDIYKPLTTGGSPASPQLRSKIDLMLLAAIRSEVALSADRTLAEHRIAWSDTLATFLND